MTPFQQYLRKIPVERSCKLFNVSERTVRYWRAGAVPATHKLPMIRKKTGLTSTEICG